MYAPARSVRTMGITAAILALALVGCGSAPATTPTETPGVTAPVPTASTPAPTTAPAFVQPETCEAMLGPVLGEITAQGAQKLSGPRDATAGSDPQDVGQRILGLGGVFCSYAIVGVDGSGTGFGVAALTPQSRTEVEAYLGGLGLTRGEDGDAVTFTALGGEQEYAPAEVHVLRADSWIYVGQNFGGQREFDKVATWAAQLGEQSYPG